MVDLQIRLLKQLVVSKFHMLVVGGPHMKASNMTTPLVVNECGVEIFNEENEACTLFWNCLHALKISNII